MPGPSSNEDPLDRARKLLARAEDESVTPTEAVALTGKAAELMARYGIDRARLGAQCPATDQPADTVMTLEDPWAGVKAHLLGGLGQALRCQCVELDDDSATRMHVFGYASDLERAAILFSSLLVQMTRGLAARQVPESRAKAWMVGFIAAVVSRVRAAEQAAAQAADGSGTEGPAAGGDGLSTAVVLADRELVIRRITEQAYPRTEKTYITFTGGGYCDGYRQGQNADISGAQPHPGPKASGTG